MSKRDDLELVARFLAEGDREALGELLERYRSASYGLALHVTRSAADAEDACQEAALRAVRKLERFDPAGSFRAWYLKMTYNIATDLLRRRGARQAREEKVVPTRASEAPSSQMERAELDSAVASALRAVEPRYRLPVVLRYEQGLTYREAAAVLDLPEGTTRTYASRGIEKLRERLAGAGFALAPAVIAGTLKSSASVTVPASVGAALSKIAATASVAPKAALGGAGAATLKGGIMLKAAASIIAASAIAGAVAVSTGALSGGGGTSPALPGVGTNPVAKQTEREEVFEFTQKPSVKKAGGKVVITFASKGKCDATVAIVDGKGKIVRHLASGVLGANAPWPFKQNSLSQSIEWDGKDNQGKPAPAGCKVRVSLGLKATLDKLIGDEPRMNAGSPIMACDAQGNVYCVSDNRSSIICVLDREGNYVRTVWPPPATVPPEKLSTIELLKRLDGKSVPNTTNGCGGSYFKSRGTGRSVAIFSPLWRHTPAVTPDGKELLFLMGGVHNARFLIRLGTDGSLPAGSIVAIDTARYVKRREMHLAVSPDGAWVYFSGGFEEKKKNFAVYRRKLSELKCPPGESPLKNPVLPEPFVGEPAEPGDDEKHFASPRGVACDGEGNLYVADFSNDRVQAFKPDGGFLKSFPVVRPDLVAVHPKTGEVYVLSYQPCTWGGKINKEGPCFLATMVKFGGLKNPAVRASLSLGKVVPHAPYAFQMCLDATASPPGLWVTAGGKAVDKKAVGLWRIADRGGKLEKVKNLTEEINAPWKDWVRSLPTRKGYLIVDRAREELYVKDPGGCFPTHSMRIDGRTGKLIEHMKTNSEELHVGPDGLVYVRADAFGRHIIRFNPADGKCVPFKKGVEFTWRGQKTTAIRTPHSDAGCGTRTFQDGFSVAANGDLYVILTEADPARIRPILAKLGQKGMPGKGWAGLFLQIYAPDGSLKHASALPGLIHSNGLRVARNGNVYISLAARKVDVKEPDGIAPGQRPDFRWGMLVQFDSAFDKFPIGRIHGTYETPNPDGGSAYTLSDSRYRPTPEPIRWDYAGVSPSLSQGGNCVCYNSRFDLDDFDRAWVPMAQNFSVNALDANGNVIIRVGTYGNPDSRGKDSPIVDPETGQLRPRRADDSATLAPPKELTDEIGFRAPRFVAASDEALYVNDTGNQRIVRAKLGYRAEEELPLP